MSENKNTLPVNNVAAILSEAIKGENQAIQIWVKAAEFAMSGKDDFEFDGQKYSYSQIKMQMNKKEILTTCGDKTGEIDKLIAFLNKAKEKGATHYAMEWSGDPLWAFKWFRTFAPLSNEDVKRRKIEDLKKKIKSLEDEQ